MGVYQYEGVYSTDQENEQQAQAVEDKDVAQASVSPRLL